VRRLPIGVFAVLLAGLASARPAFAEVEIEARLGRSQLSMGETTTLEVTVRGAGFGSLGEPDLNVPDGVQILGSGREQSFSWVNGKSTAATVFRYELEPSAAGRYRLGPIDVRVGGQTYRSEGVTLEVTAASVRVGASGQGPASLTVEAIPPSPYVGQQTILRVRLVQRAALAEDPQYSPPAMPGFWTDRTSAPESFYGDQGNQRVLVTETRTRVYPLAVGVATVGEAAASLVLAGGGDPFSLVPGRPRRPILVRSAPLNVTVRPLPGGAPAGFTGAVGSFATQWSADRGSTARDVPITVRLDVRGSGNLPLIRPPELADPDFEVFASSVDDSLGGPGGTTPGRKRFQWTVLPRRQGRLGLPAPAFSWFNPGTGRYEESAPGDLVFEVGPALFAAGTAEGFPVTFAERPLEPGARGPEPWAYAISGLLLGVGVALWRWSLRPAPDASLRAQQLEWLRVVGRGSGSDFWRAAEDATAWLEARGSRVAPLRERIASARYGGSAAAAQNPEPLRRALVEQLSRALPPLPRRVPFRVGAVVVTVAAVAWAVLLGPSSAGDRARHAARAADQAARAGDLASARSTWDALWRETGPHPALAARLAWLDVQAGRIGPAAAWVLRGEAAEPRDAALAWVGERVREGGGLVGASPMRLPLTRLEWSLLAVALGIGAGLAWPRRRLAVALVLATVAVGLVYPVQGWMAERSHRSVVVRQVPLEGADLDLQPGQVVEELGREGPRARVRAGRSDQGTVPAEAIESVFGARAVAAGQEGGG
jgi:hypothetical protein